MLGQHFNSVFPDSRFGFALFLIPRMLLTSIFLRLFLSFCLISFVSTPISISPPHPTHPEISRSQAYGVFGGYIAASSHMIDFVRSFGAGFIFTTAIPPAVAAAALASVRHLRESQTERAQHQAW